MAAIYTLSDPRTGLVRYVGYTCKSPEKRFKEHLSDVHRFAKSHRLDWLRLLLKDKTPPVLNVVSTCEEWQAPTWERAYIAAYRALDFDLVNGTDGGEGVRGQKFSPETRAKMSAAATGNKNSLGHRHTEESKKKMSESHKVSGNRPPSFKGHSHSPESRAKSSASHKRRFELDPELRKRIGDAVRARRRGGGLA